MPASFSCFLDFSWKKIKFVTKRYCFNCFRGCLRICFHTGVIWLRSSKNVITVLHVNTEVKSHAAVFLRLSFKGCLNVSKVKFTPTWKFKAAWNFFRSDVRFTAAWNGFSSEAAVRRCFVNKTFLKLSQSSREKTCAQACNFIKKETLAQMFYC